MSVTVCTVNVNGIRAAWRKGMAEWLPASGADIVTLQEVRAPDEIVDELLAGSGYDVVHTASVHKGRSGVAVLSKRPILASRIGLGMDPADDSGRWIEADIDAGDGRVVTIASVYVHSGEVDTPKQEAKYRFLEAMTDRLAALSSDGTESIVTGDLNIAHTERDIKNWRSNRTKSGFLPEERAYVDGWFDTLDLTDVHRALAGDVAGPYTWWSMRGKAFDNDAGWRIDYQLATGDLARSAQSARVDRALSWAERWSDHAPLLIDYAV